MASKRGKSKKKNPCWKGYTAMGSDGKIVMKKKGKKMVPACRPIKGKKDGASMDLKTLSGIVPALAIRERVKGKADRLKNANFTVKKKWITLDTKNQTVKCVLSINQKQAKH